MINRMPQAKFILKSTLEKLWNIRPTVNHFRVFGSVYYVFVPDHLRMKFDKKAIRCIFVGYDSGRKGWRCSDPITGRGYVSRDVVFNEASSWWPLEKMRTEDIEKIEEKVHDECQEKTCILLITINKEDKENAV